jgi:hypothetical protein
MASIFGSLNLNSTDRVYKATQGQQVIYDAVIEYVNRVNSELSAALSVFVEESTSDHKRRYKLPGGGYLERVGETSRGASAQNYGSWDVAFPLEEFQRGISTTRVGHAYMTVQELDNHVQGVVAANVNTVRFEVLKRIFNNTQSTFIDPLWGSLSVEPLANGDSVTYPPILGAVAEATENHYLESGYAATAISTSNNPYQTIKDELEEHFGAPQGNSNIVVFINPAEAPETEAISGYKAIDDRFVIPGADTARLFNLPSGLPGRIIGRVSGCFVAEWRSMPANYMIGIHLDAPKPLIKRIDPIDTGLGEGLQLVAEDADFPFQKSTWSHRFGFGAGNRLNGVVMELGTGGSYSIPAGYS